MTPPDPWSTADPREVLARDCEIVAYCDGEAWAGRVYVRHAWAVQSHAKDRRSITEDDRWPDGWAWTAPPTERTS